MENKSEVARLRESIRLSYEAAQSALYDPAIVAKHEFITKRMENMQQAHTQLQAILGVEEAIRLVVQTLENVQEVRTQRLSHYD
jgi:hypothetical protein